MERGLSAGDGQEAVYFISGPDLDPAGGHMEAQVARVQVAGHRFLRTAKTQ
jgi:hypothetical protein